MRIFIGIGFPQDVKKQIAEMQKIVRGNSIGGRWKYIDNFHLTLKFLGEVRDEQVSAIFDSLKNSFENVRHFSIKMGELGCFRGQDCFRVVFLELVDKDGHLNYAYNNVEECCNMLGFPRETRKYTPHITVAQDVVLKGEFSTVKYEISRLPKQEILVNSIDIIKSEQINTKRIYTNVHSILLK
jgi:2'-5' RNA ligase